MGSVLLFHRHLVIVFLMFILLSSERQLLIGRVLVGRRSVRISPWNGYPRGKQITWKHVKFDFTESSPTRPTIWHMMKVNAPRTEGYVILVMFPTSHVRIFDLPQRRDGLCCRSATIEPLSN